MMRKLALNNATKSVKDYGVYFFTLVLGVCVFYMFNSIYAQEEVMSFSHRTHSALNSLTQIIGYVSVFVSVVLGFLIVYANNYFIKRRKKELGIYMTLGMNKRQISNILVLETSVIAVMALVCGLFLGVILSQFMSLVTAKIFEADLTGFKFVLAPAAMWKCVMYFGIIFVIVILFNTVTLTRYKLIDLIDGGRQNEGLKLKSPVLALAIFIAAIGCLGIAYNLIINNGLIDLTPDFYMSIGFGTLGTGLFFFSLTGFGILLIQKSKAYYFDELNMFVMRQLNSKVNTNFLTMSIVCLVLLLTIGILSCGLAIQNILSAELKDSAPFDVSMRLSEDYFEEGQVIKAEEKLVAYDNVKDSMLITLYGRNDITFNDLLRDAYKESNYFLESSVKFITLQDLNKSLKKQGKDLIELSKGHYGVVSCMDETIDYSEKIVESQKTIQLANTSLAAPDQFFQLKITNLYDSIMLVIDESDLESLNVISQIMNINYNKTDEESILETQEHWNDLETDDEGVQILYYLSKYDLYANSVTGKAIISFLAIYLGFVFLITSAAILALQQLSEAIDNKKRYDMLRKLGADKKMVRKALFKQIALYFMLPLGLAVIHSVVGIYVANRTIMTIGKMDVWANSSMTAIAVILVYGAYFIFTYIGSKNYIEQV